jgi:uncharacterized protein (TIGR00661 family)
MRILYGVVGEGMGHATRSKVILDHLINKLGHEVQIVVSGRAHAYLRRAFPEVPVHEIAGLKMIYEDNTVRRVRTALELLRSLPAYAQNFDVFRHIQQDFGPELCVADFETFAYLYAKQHDLPVLSIDNMQIINRCNIEKDFELPEDLQLNYHLTKAIVKAKLPRCDHYLITTFFFPPVRKKRTSLFPPILRDEILAARAEARMGEHVLVYQTSDSYADLPAILQSIPGQRFVVYGYKRNEELGNVTLKDFSEAGFVDDLKTARAVIAGGGFSLMGEAVYLGKPVLSVPLRNQFEQALNALYLQHLGYGECCDALTAERVGAFLDRAPTYARAVARHKQDGNRMILDALERLLKEIRKKGRLVG